MISRVPPPIGPRRASRRRALDVVLAHVAVAAVDLHGLVGDLDGGVAGEELRDRDLLEAVLAGDEQAQAVVGEVAAGLDHASPSRRACAGSPGSGRSGGRTPCAPSRTSSVRSNVACMPPTAPSAIEQPLPLEVGHDQVEALVLLAEQVLRRHAHVRERRARRCRRRASRASPACARPRSRACPSRARGTRGRDGRRSCVVLTAVT